MELIRNTGATPNAPIRTPATAGPAMGELEDEERRRHRLHPCSGGGEQLAQDEQTEIADPQRVERRAPTGWRRRLPGLSPRGLGSGRYLPLHRPSGYAHRLPSRRG